MLKTLALTALCFPWPLLFAGPCARLRVAVQRALAQRGG